MSRNEAWIKDIDQAVQLITDIVWAQTSIESTSKTRTLIHHTLKRLVDNVIAVEGKQDASSNTRNEN